MTDRKHHAKLAPDDKAWRQFALKGALPPSPPPPKPGSQGRPGPKRWEAEGDS